VGRGTSGGERGQRALNTMLVQADRVHTLRPSLSRADREYLFRYGYDQAKRYFHKAKPEGAGPPPV
jgi:hypothetical protein